MSHQTIVERFAEFATQTTFLDIPDRVIEKVKLQILTIITAARFSDWHPLAQKIYQAEKANSPGLKTATVIALNKKLPVEAAAIVNAAYSMSLDFDDYMLMGHMGHSAVFPALAYLEESAGIFQELITATTVANEIMGRLSLACFFGPLNGQMWSYIHNVGAAVSLGKVKKFTAQQMTAAIALALYQPNFCLTPGFWHEGSKLLTAAIPLRGGIKAALYAEQGLKGPTKVIEGPLGFLHFFSFAPIPEFLEGLSEVWLSDSLSYKRYPGTSYVGAPIDASRQALHQLGYEKIEDVSVVKKIRVDTTFLSYSIESLSRNYPFEKLDPIQINFSVRYSVAYALLRGDLKPEHFKENEIKRFQADIIQLARKIEVCHDWGQTFRTLETFPQLISILWRIPSPARQRIIAHIKELNRGTSMGLGQIVSGLYQLLPGISGRSFLKSLFEKKVPVALSQLNLPDYQMRQSAQATITLTDQRQATAFFLIPTGGSGQDIKEREKWVIQRYELAFHRDFEPVQKLMAKPDTGIRTLMKAWLVSCHI